ncbi:Glucose-6-phosphate 1-dehydrogenase [Clydaea vesicula]|uniref:Glucose-6-phosphate 1-dehydrogenase n=1 Tax=Clydaea vesicula TaxID=447962 RepID=A0AAD5U5P1_9FUNG|nr:Glucose-6-phosphate 1-dehydrogenase [Clydaea vesicula]KAJ3395064.1 Glucose-6-phosphate 1-dehydrogenase [Lobulomyces angularis]
MNTDIVFEMTSHSTEKENTAIIILGASGDLAFKKTYPALFGLFKNDFLPKSCQIIGYARSEIKLDEFKKRITSKIKVSDEDKAVLERFLEICTYCSGSYDKKESFQNLDKFVTNLEGEDDRKKNRIFYMALPPTVFISASEGLKENVYSKKGDNRLIVEKPFGKDFDSSRVLSRALSKHWKEDEIYRIDHYLGKEMVKNLMMLRFGNVIFGAVWNRYYISNVQITFKEVIGTEGRGGYFNEFGIIRDIMQNHLFQILSIVAMGRPVTLDAEDVRNEKVKVLRSIKPLSIDDVLLGQYTRSADGKNKGYKDDEGVPQDSYTATFAAAVFNIANERWDGVPFILKCGKALDEAKAEDVPGSIYPGLARNELVIRIQPKEAVYMKVMNKEPGLSNAAVISELDLSYTDRYSLSRIPDAYESLILDVLKGEKSNFVRDDELDAAWKIFTPVLHQIEKEKIKPELYEFGSRGPASLSRWIENHGYKRTHGYQWKSTKL